MIQKFYDADLDARRGGVQQAQQTERYVSDFEKELREVINRHSRENISDTPDFILAEFMDKCLMAFSVAITQRDYWYKFIPAMSNIDQEVKASVATDDDSSNQS